MIIRVLLILFGIGLLNSCNIDDDSNFQSAKINFTEIGIGALYGNGQEGISESNLIISNTNDWQYLISQMNAVNSVSENFSEINIDFNRYTVIAIFLGVKGQGWEIRTESVIENEKNIAVSISETVFANSVINQPFSIIKIKRTEKPIIVEY